MKPRLQAAFSPWANGLFRHTDAGLGWDLNVRLLKVPVAAGIHDNYCNRLVLHHVEKFLSCDPTSWHRSYQIKSSNQRETNKNYKNGMKFKKDFMGSEINIMAENFSFYRMIFTNVSEIITQVFCVLLLTF